MKYCDFKRGFDNLCPENLDAWIPVSHALQIDLDCTKVKFITIYHKFVSLNWYMLFWSVTSIRPFCTICINIIIIFFETYFVIVEKKQVIRSFSNYSFYSFVQSWFSLSCTICNCSFSCRLVEQYEFCNSMQQQQYNMVVSRSNYERMTYCVNMFVLIKL